MVKNLPAMQSPKRVSLISGSGKSPGGGHGNPLQYSCLENPMDRGAWWATVHGVVKSWPRLKQFRMQALGVLEWVGRGILICLGCDLPSSQQGLHSMSNKTC